MSTITSSDLISALRNPMFKIGESEVREAFELLRQRLTSQRAAQRLQFRIGETVTFNDRYGRQLIGYVEKINSKTIGVNVGGMKWRVCPSLLRKPSE